MGIIATAKAWALGGSRRPVLSDDTDTVLVDVGLDYSRTRSGQVAEHPIEDRETVADHVNRPAEEIRLTALLTDDGISLRSLTKPSAAERAAQIYKWRDESTVISLAYKELVEDLLIESANEPYEGDLGGGRRIELVMKKVIFADTVAAGTGGLRESESEEE